MMSAITVYLKSGDKEYFPESSRAGGSWNTRVKYDGEFAIIENAQGKQTVFHGSSIEKIVVEESYRF